VASLREAPDRGLAANRVFLVGYAISPLGDCGTKLDLRESSGRAMRAWPIFWMEDKK
jgi:hypothetical protein